MGIGNELLSEPLAVLEDHLYEADDVVDELDYYRLQQQVQGVSTDVPEAMRGAERADEISSGDSDTPMNRSFGKLRSMVWEYFTITEKDNGKPVKAKCTYCTKEFRCETKTNGTSSMKKHLENEHSLTYTKRPPAHAPNPSSTADASANATPIVVDDSSSRKRKRVDEESAQITATNTCTHRAMAQLSIKIQKITCRLQDIRGDIREVLELHVSDFPSSSQDHRGTTSGWHLRTSSLLTRKVYGRVAEKNSIMKLLMAEDQEHTIEDVTAANGKAFPSLECLTIESCEIAGKWLSLLLRHVPELKELYLEDKLSMEEEGDSSSGEQDHALIELAQDGLVHIPLNLISSLKKIAIKLCPRLTFTWSEEGFSGFTSIRELQIWGCPGLLSPLMLKDRNDDQANRR
ncbi:hypothetical protein ACQ4PT_017389 [Festuca glaucescens]